MKIQCINIEELNEKNGNVQETFGFLPPLFYDVAVVVVVVLFLSLFVCACVCRKQLWLERIVRSSVSSQTDDATHTQHRFFCLSQLCGREKNGPKIKTEGENVAGRTCIINIEYTYSSVSSRFRADRKRNNCITERDIFVCIRASFTRRADVTRVHTHVVFILTNICLRRRETPSSSAVGARGFCKLI